MSTSTMPWRTFLARSAIGAAMVGVAVFTGVRLATADPGGPTRGDLTFAGVLPERAGRADTRLTFVFRRGMSTATVCTVTTSAFEPGPGGAFAVPVPLDGCTDARGLFDGENVFYDVRLGDVSGPLIAPNVAVTPVPYARFADQVGVNNDCPVSYVVEGRDPWIVCQRRTNPGDPTTAFDEVVRVGSGATAFWIDRYEVTICAGRDGTCGTPFNTSVDNDLASLGMPRNGQWAGRTPPLYARSGAYTNRPSRWVTWFQAEALCRASGKRLPTGYEWLAAARGTGGSSGETGCVVNGPLRETASGTSCTSEWGARDMVGNVAEWTADWYAGVGRTSFGTVPGAIYGPGTTPETNAGGAGPFPGDRRTSAGWPTVGTLYGGDGTSNISSGGYAGDGGDYRFGVPSVAVRGGHSNAGSWAGIFALDLESSPSNSGSALGFRCVVPR